MALFTDTIQIKIEPYNMVSGNITTLKITITNMVDNSKPEVKLLEINPILYSELGNTTETLERHYKADAGFRELKEQYEILKEECRRTHHDITAIIKRPTTEETAERLRQDMERSDGMQDERKKKEVSIKPVIIKAPDAQSHEEIPEEMGSSQPPESTELTPHQQAENIYDQVLESLKGKSVEEKDIMAAVLMADVSSDAVPQVTKEIVELLKEKGAIDTPRKKLSRLFGGGKKEKKTEKKEKKK